MSLKTAGLFVCASACILQAQARLLPEGRPAADVVDVVDIQREPADIRLAAITLQGNVNSGENARIYYIEQANMHDLFWLQQCEESGAFSRSSRLTLDELFKKYSDSYSTIVVYDPELPATINVASMIASVENGIAAAPGGLQRFGEGKRVIDLRNRWSSNVEAYEWAMDNLLKQMNPSVLACLHPDAVPHNLRDYLTANRIFTFWITGPEKQDGKKSSFEKEKAFAEKLFKKFPSGTPVLGFWYSGKDPGINEYSGVGLAGEYGLLTIPSDWNANLSFLSGVRVQWDAVADQYRRTQEITAPAYRADKIYLCFAVIDSGDAPSYWQSAQHDVWQDKSRGQIPVAWSFGPTAAELMPSVVQWYYKNMTPGDSFFMGISGAGYVHPYRDFFAKTAHPKQSWADYVRQTETYMHQFGLIDLALYTDAWRPFDRTKNDDVTWKFADGIEGLRSIILGMGRDDGMTAGNSCYMSKTGDVLINHVLTRWNSANIERGPENNRWLAEEIRTNSPASGTGFMMIHPLSWTYYPSDLIEVMKLLGDRYEAVSLPVFQTLCRQSLQAETNHSPRSRKTE